MGQDGIGQEERGREMKETDVMGREGIHEKRGEVKGQDKT